MPKITARRRTETVGYKQELELLVYLTFNDTLDHVLKSEAQNSAKAFEEGLWISIQNINLAFLTGDKPLRLFKTERDTSVALMRLEAQGYVEHQDILPRKKEKVKDKKELRGRKWRLNYENKEDYLKVLEIFYQYDKKLFWAALHSPYDKTILAMAKASLESGIDLTKFEKEIKEINLQDILISEAVKGIEDTSRRKFIEEKLAASPEMIRNLIANEGLWQAILATVWKGSPSFIYRLIKGEINFRAIQQKLNLPMKETFILLVNSFKIADTAVGVTPAGNLDMDFFHYKFHFHIETVLDTKNIKSEGGKRQKRGQY